MSAGMGSMSKGMGNLAEGMDPAKMAEAMKEKAESMLPETQIAYIKKVRKYQQDPLEAAIEEVTPLIPEDKQEQYDKILKMTRAPDDFIEDPLWPHFDRDPVMAYLDESEKLVDDPDSIQ